MATSQDVFGTWLRTRIAPRLRERGFAGSGQDFHRRVGPNWAAINVQRRLSSTAVRAQLDAPDDGVRLAAAFAAGRLGDVAAIPRLLTMIERDRRYTACYAAIAAASIASRLDAEGRANVVAALRARHIDAVGHERPLLAHLIRQVSDA